MKKGSPHNSCFSKKVKKIAPNRHSKEFRCCFCGEVSITGSDLKIHVYSSHAEKRSYFCGFCGVVFPCNRELDVHRRIHSGKKTYNCDICNKKFSRKYSLTRHTVLHTGEKPHICKVCNKTFSRKYDLTKHTRLHTGEKPYICDKCNKRFSLKSVLTQHMKIHTGEKLFVCENCNKSFTYKCNYTAHLRTHTRKKRFRCYICGKTFSNNYALSRHAWIHSERKIYAYEYCRKEFVLKYKLKIHQCRSICRIGVPADSRNNLSKIDASIERHQNMMCADKKMHDYQLPEKVIPEYCNFDPNHVKAHAAGDPNMCGTQILRKETLMDDGSYVMGDNSTTLNVGSNLSEKYVMEPSYQMSGAASFLPQVTIPAESAAGELDVCIASLSGINFQESRHKYHTHKAAENDSFQTEMDKAGRDGQKCNSHYHENYVSRDWNFNPENFSDQPNETFSNRISGYESNVPSAFQDMYMQQFRDFNAFSDPRTDEDTVLHELERVLNDPLREKDQELPILTQDILDSELHQSSSSFQETNFQGTETDFPGNWSIPPK